MLEAFTELREEMDRETTVESPTPFSRSVRPFRQKFCQLARAQSGLSYEDLAAALNQHPDILKLDKLPAYKNFYPITPDFLKTLETEITKIWEYNPYNQGLLGIGAFGTPTKDIAAAIAKICGVHDVYKRFENWSLAYEFGTATVAKWNLH
nr:hypothetical protein HAGR004_24920 [Bdellovibrio sp. HAGR004]